MINIYLDDERSTPDGYVRCYWPQEVIQLLKTEKVNILSLDHDLGDDSRGTGYDVLLWLEEQAALYSFEPPRFITVHSANISARLKMVSAIRHIEQLAGRRP